MKSANGLVFLSIAFVLVAAYTSYDPEPELPTVPPTAEPEPPPVDEPVNDPEEPPVWKFADDSLATDTFLSASAQFTLANPDLTFTAGRDRSVTIDGETGAVTFEGMEPDEAAKVFWRAVAATWPHFCIAPKTAF